MAAAKDGDKVKVHYTGKLDDGTVFDSSDGRDPLEFTIGEGQIIPGFETGVQGMEPGEAKTVKIPADQAYGPHREEGVLVVNRTELPPDMNPEVGEELEVRYQEGQATVVRVTDAAEETVTLDANHPLAGKDLTFDIELVEIG